MLALPDKIRTTIRLFGEERLFITFALTSAFPRPPLARIRRLLLFQAKFSSRRRFLRSLLGVLMTIFAPKLEEEEEQGGGIHG